MKINLFYFLFITTMWLVENQQKYSLWFILYIISIFILISIEDNLIVAVLIEKPCIENILIRNHTETIEIKV